MPQPKNADVHVNRAIDAVAINYQNAQYIAEQAFPTVSVQNKSDVYYKFNKGDRFRDQAANDRQPGSRAPRGGWNVTNEPYSCKRISFAQGVPDDIVDNADDAVRPFENATDFVMEQILIRRERRISTDIFTTGVWGTDKTGGTDVDKWSDFANGDPAKNISDGQEVLRTNTGRRGNTLIMGAEVAADLRLNPDVIDRFKHTSNGIISLAQIAQWLEIERILIGEAIYNTANEGQTESMSDIWGKNALLMFVAPNPGIDVPSAGYTFQWKNVSTKTFREEAEEQDVVEANVDLDMKVTASDFGYFFSGIVD